MQVAAIAFTWLVVIFVAAPPLSAQEPLAAARDLYASADYEKALRLLDSLPRDRYAHAERQTIEFYRALCLLAVERRENVAGHEHEQCLVVGRVALAVHVALHDDGAANDLALEHRHAEPVRAVGADRAQRSRHLCAQLFG